MIQGRERKTRSESGTLSSSQLSFALSQSKAGAASLSLSKSLFKTLSNFRRFSNSAGTESSPETIWGG